MSTPQEGQEMERDWEVGTPEGGNGERPPRPDPADVYQPPTLPATPPYPPNELVIYRSTSRD